jgi:hypothetical protein
VAPIRIARRALVALAVAAAAGCSGVKPYPDTYDKNAVVRVKTDSGGFLSRTRADLDLYTVDTARCTAKYLGSVRLRNEPVELGLPVGETVLLVYVFSRSSLGRDSSSSLEMMTPTRKGYRYEFEVSYVRSSYGATGVELAPGRTKVREIEHRRMRDCVAK